VEVTKKNAEGGSPLKRQATLPAQEEGTPGAPVSLKRIPPGERQALGGMSKKERYPNHQRGPRKKKKTEVTPMGGEGTSREESEGLRKRGTKLF